MTDAQELALAQRFAVLMKDVPHSPSCPMAKHQICYCVIGAAATKLYVNFQELLVLAKRAQVE